MTPPSTPEMPADPAAEAVPRAPVRIEPTKSAPEPMPPTGGHWVRHADGGLAPADESTARAAGLRWPD